MKRRFAQIRLDAPLLSEDQEAQYSAFKEFVSLNVEPFAEAWDREEQIPPPVISLLGDAGYLGVTMPRDYAGQGGNAVTFGLLNEAVGRGSSALTDVITCQAMVSMALLKWGTPAQKNRWIPSLATGATIGAFALTEPGAGSDTQALVTECAAGIQRWRADPERTQEVD